MRDAPPPDGPLRRYGSSLSIRTSNGPVASMRGMGVLTTGIYAREVIWLARGRVGEGVAADDAVARALLKRAERKESRAGPSSARGGVGGLSGRGLEAYRAGRRGGAFVGALGGCGGGEEGEGEGCEEGAGEAHGGWWDGNEGGRICSVLYMRLRRRCEAVRA